MVWACVVVRTREHCRDILKLLLAPLASFGFDIDLVGVVADLECRLDNNENVVGSGSRVCDVARQNGATETARGDAHLREAQKFPFLKAQPERDIPGSLAHNPVAVDRGCRRRGGIGNRVRRFFAFIAVGRPVTSAVGRSVVDIFSAVCHALIGLCVGPKAKRVSGPVGERLSDCSHDPVIREECRPLWSQAQDDRRAAPSAKPVRLCRALGDGERRTRVVIAAQPPHIAVVVVVPQERRADAPGT